MQYEIKLQRLFAGHAATTGRPGEKLRVITREFVSSEDGDLLISRLEGFPTQLLSHVPGDTILLPSAISRMLAIIRRDRTATLYINEPKVYADIQAKEHLPAHSLVSKDQIADVRALQFADIDVPPDVGLMFFFTVNWRRGLFYDFWPLQPEPKERDYDLSAVLGQCYAYLLFQDRFRITDSEWQSFIQEGWFPFVSLPSGITEKMLAHVRSGWKIDEVLSEISSFVRESLDTWCGHWAAHRYMQEHLELIERAKERFLDGDFASAVSILYPRIEGAMRSFHEAVTPEIRANQHTLLESAVPKDAAEKRPYSVLLPARFRQYLGEVYFRDFEPGKRADLSRHSVAHGVADPAEFTEKAATLAFLILAQLAYYLAHNREAN